MTLGARMKNGLLYMIRRSAGYSQIRRLSRRPFPGAKSGSQWLSLEPWQRQGVVFCPGHEAYSVFKEELPLRVIENAVSWLAAELPKGNKQ
jgi:hypothetical protein